MKYVVNSENMKAIDQYTVATIKLPAMVLMERAAMEIVQAMKMKIRKEDRILVVCGPGNNGGDGVAAGRILYLQGFHVALLFVCKEEEFSPKMKEQVEIAKNLKINIENNNKLGEYNIIIDAIFGIGLSRPVKGEIEDIIQEINRNNNMVFSVDIPSGISSDNGRIMNTAVRADVTITFGFMKQGLLLYPGAEYAGEIIVADIGFPHAAVHKAKPAAFYYETVDLKQLPGRNSYSHKGTFGRVLVIAGSKGMSGAAYLSAKAAYRTGAGLVKLLTASENRNILQFLLPEALFSAYDSKVETKDEWKKELQETLDWASVIVVGPGLGTSKQKEELLEFVLQRASKPLILDADALNILAASIDRESIIDPDKRLARLMEILPDGTILTPHLLELSRIIGIPVMEITDNLIDTAGQCSYNKLIYVIKDARTVVASDNRLYINCSGNQGMATGGSGDVLTGILAALIAQGMKPYDAACMGVYLHGLAGDEASKNKSSYSLMAEDIIESTSEILRKKERGEL